MSSRMDLIDLARHLRQESLFVSSEKQNLQALNEKVLKAIENLYHLSWIARQQRLNLDSLILSDSHPTVCCQKANILENVKFIDSYKQLGVHDCAYSEFLQQFRENPKLISMCLNAGEKININSMHNVVNIILSAVYGNCILPEDEIHVLNLLKELMILQLALSDNPRRLLRHGSCAFSRVYKTFNGCLFSAKIFLTAALHDPIMHVLMGDDLFLDIDPSKAAIRFHPQERIRHFGKEGTAEYATNLQRYRNWTINKLYNLTMRFIEGIRNNLYCFPQSLSWLARQIYNLVMKAKRVEVREVGAMCADLVFAFFICPAIVDPELYGITDMHISYIARFNLMQVAQILQMLAMSKWEEIDPKLMDLYGKFEKDCMSSLLDLILEGSTNESPSSLVNQFQDLSRSAILITESELMSLVSFLRTVESETQDSILRKMLHSLLSPLPPSTVSVPPISQNGDVFTSTPSANYNDSLPHTPSMKRSFIGKGKRSSKIHNNVIGFSENNTDDVNSVSEFDNVPSSKMQLEDVLVVPILGVDFDCPGMLSEDKVLAVEKQKKNHSRKVAENEDGDTVSCGPEIVEKRTRFSLSQDQESVGTSDNLEAISEAASNHSVASSLDLENDNDENENDNLSDMVSANVSGRGTPNVSGRDTPSSQMEGDDREQRPLDLTAPTRKQNQEDIEDKFGKFEIQPMIEGDETKSMVSDTWSTDVLASDSETVEQLDVSAQMALESQNLALLDTSETASQSDAWSTDVLASDTERLQDVDTDDTASVARSDDTARSEADGDVSQALDGIRIDGSDFGDADHLSDPFIPVSITKTYGCSTDFPLFIPPRMSSSVNYSSEPSGLKQKRPSFSEGLEEESDSARILEKLPSDVPRRMASKTEYGPDAATTKIPDLMHLDISNHMHISAVECTSSQTLANESLTDMQSLGRVSLAVKELPDVEDTDSGSLLLDSLQETVSMTMQNDGSGHRTSISDILSLDLTRTLNLHAENCMVEDHSKRNESKSYLTEIEKELLGDKMYEDNKDSSGCGKTEILNSKTTLQFDRASKRKLHDSSQIDDVFQRLSATSISSSGSSTGSTEIFTHPVTNSDAMDLTTRNVNETSSLHGKLNAPNFLLGAIPKSISFDKTISELDHQQLDDKLGSDKNRKSLFKLSGFRFTFKGRNRKSHLSFRPDSGTKGDDLGSGLKGTPCRTSQGSLAEMRSLQLEAGDEILAKYRKKSPSALSGSSIKSSADSTVGNSSDMSESMLMDGEHQHFEPISMENSPVFQDAKRKLRLVLGSADFQTLPWLNTVRGHSSSGSGQRFTDNELVAFLKVLLAEAVNLNPRPLMAHLHEALRCVRMFDDAGCQKLFKSLRDDYKKRAPYIAYLVRCRQGLLSTLSHLETIIERIERDKQVCNHYLIMICVRVFLEKHDIQDFLREFQKLTVSDEKAALVENFLSALFNDMEDDLMWQTASKAQIEHAQIVVERRIMDRIYTLALHPNGDGDVLRDKVLHEHMQKLSEIITPNHKDLGIPKHYHSQCPWPSAQAELVLINAYKTPRDKIQCVVRCCRTIMNVLSMASEKMIPAADDLMPVLVFVLIKANPPNLLSTVQYVNTFYEKQLESEEAYWWTQFCSGVEFIKTMDY